MMERDVCFGCSGWFWVAISFEGQQNDESHRHVVIVGFKEWGLSLRFVNKVGCTLISGHCLVATSPSQGVPKIGLQRRNPPFSELLFFTCGRFF